MRTLVAGVALALGAAFARAGGEPIAHVEVAGQGETQVALIHNTLADWGVWDSFMERNADRYTMRAVRLAGMGGSEAMELPEDNPLDRMEWTDRAVDAFVELLEEDGGESVYVIGHGIGGVLAMRAAIERPDLVAGVILVDTMPAHPLTAEGIRLEDDERLRYLLEGFLAAIENVDLFAWRARWREIARRQTRDEQEADRLAAMADQVEFEVWKRWMSELQIPDLTDALDESGVRVLGAGAVNMPIIQMFATRVMVEEFWRLAFDGVENSEVTFFDDTSHYIFLDRPEAFDAMVERFISGETQPAYSFRESGE